jgi:hypothetical protein
VSELLVDSIKSADGTITILTTSGSAIQVGGSYTLPTSDGSDGQVLTTDGSGAVTFETVSAGVSTGKAIAMAIVFG